MIRIKSLSDLDLLPFGPMRVEVHKAFESLVRGCMAAGHGYHPEVDGDIALCENREDVDTISESLVNLSAFEEVCYDRAHDVFTVTVFVSNAYYQDYLVPGCLLTSDEHVELRDEADYGRTHRRAA